MSAPHHHGDFADVPGRETPAVDDVQRVDTEKVDEPRYRFGRRAGIPGGEPGVRMFAFGADAAAPMPGPPVVATWVCLAVAWLFLGSRIPFTVLLGVPFDLVALLLAVVSLTRGGVFTGIFVLLLGTVGSLVVYLIGLFRFLAM